MFVKENNKGFTLIELLAVIVVLAVVILIAVTAVIPRMNNAKKKALVDEALVYLKAAKEAYSFDPELLNASSCTSVTDLNGKYVKKDSDNYKGAIKTTYSDGVVSQTIYLTDGKFYVSGSDNITIDNVIDEKPAGFLNSCGDYNPILAGNVDINTLGYKLLMNEGGSTLDENLAVIDERTANINFNASSYDSTNSGIHKAEDDDGASFFYRGDVNNNWLEFGGFYWRILRINGDGSIRIIYSGLKNSTHADNDALIFNSLYQKVSTYTTEESSTKLVDDISGLTSDKIQTTYTPLPYIGYMYDTNRSLSIVEQPQGFANDDPTDFWNLYSSTDLASLTETYFFKNFDPNSDCSTKDGENACTLKCRSLGTDCVKSTWSSISSIEGISADASDYSASWLSLYTGPYKYICSGSTNNSVTRSNSDGTTSVYASCASVYKIVLFRSASSSMYVKRVMYNLNPKEDSHSKTKDSNLKKEIDLWYSSYILNGKDSSNNNLESYLTDNIFCSDKSFTGNSYNSYIRTSSKKPTLKCTDRKNDGFTLGDLSQSTVQSSGKGNGMLKYPVATVTEDELLFACVRYSATTANCYFNSSSPFWTLTPYSLSSSSNNSSYSANGFMYTTTRSSSQIRINAYRTQIETSGIRPVINLKASVLYDSGSGTEADPYIVKLPTT